MSRHKPNGRRKIAPFARLDRLMITSPEWAELSGTAVKLLIDLLAQYRGNNNGDLDVRWKRMEGRGWKSKATLYNAVRKLEQGGWIVKSRQGGKNYPSLYAVTFFEFDECKGRNLTIAPMATAKHLWRKKQDRCPRNWANLARKLGQ